MAAPDLLQYVSIMITLMIFGVFPCLWFILRSLWKIDRRLVKLEMKTGLHRRSDDDEDQL